MARPSVDSLRKQHDYRTAIDDLNLVPAAMADKYDPDDPDAKQQLESTRLRAWQPLADDCARNITPGRKPSNAVQIAAVLSATDIPDAKRTEFQEKLGSELVRRFAKAVNNNDLETADRILKSVAEVAKDAPQLDATFQEKLGSELAPRFEKAVTDNDFDMAERILKGVAEVAKIDPPLYAALHFDLVSSGQDSTKRSTTIT